MDLHYESSIARAAAATTGHARHVGMTVLAASRRATESDLRTRPLRKGTGAVSR